MSPQQPIAHYRITAKLGEGGMGEVWRATDTKLNRDVAIKILPEAFAQDADRMARFAREAQVLASLNHPNIAAIYGVEERALIMELVEGPTLAERMAQGAIPVEEVLPILNQIVDALEYAHEKNVIHRDLKPANIKVTGEGRVKVLDFGLAKALTPEMAAHDPASSPTLTMRATIAGVIMGTAGYMAPEQARGQNVEKRADIWAFGVVVYEMLTGRQLFTGPTISDTLAAVLKEEPDLSRMPPKVRRLVQSCLRKDAKQRLQAIGDARILLDEPQIPIASMPVRRRSALSWAALAIASVAALLGWWRATRPSAPRPLMRFSVDLGPDAVAGRHITAAISPDGTRLVYSVRGTRGVTQLATRLLEQSTATILAGTENAFDPFFSPDGQWIGFEAEDKLKKVSVQGGAAVTLCETNSLYGASWGEDGNIIASLHNRLDRVPAAGGKPEEILKPEDRGLVSQRWPQILPGGQTVLFTSHTLSTGFDEANLEVVNLITRQVKIVQRSGYFGRYLPSGHLLYIHQGTLFAAPFDPRSPEVKGAPTPLLEDLAADPVLGGGQFDFSGAPSGLGIFVYLSGKASGADRTVVWMDSAGRTRPLLPAPAAYLQPRISPDGQRLAVSRDNDIWVYDIQRDTPSRLTSNQQNNRYPTWTPDGKQLVFSSSSGIWWIRADGSGQPQQLLETKAVTGATSFTPDGRTLAYFQLTAGTGFDILTLPLDISDLDHPKPGKPGPFLRTDKSEVHPAFSPDGHWLAYTSNESGIYEVFVRPFPGGGARSGSGAGGKWQISAGGGRFPLWSRNGKDLFYQALDARIMVTEYTAKGDSFAPGKARQWSDKRLLATGSLPNYDLAPDGERFAVFPLPEAASEDKASLHVTVLVNFFDYLRRRIPAK